MEQFAFEVELQLPVSEALERVTSALKAEGFGILTSIDVRDTFKQKLGEDFRPYYILGACNPALAHRALSRDGRIGLMLPCTVTLEEDPQGVSRVRIANPEMMVQMGDLGKDEVLREVAGQARTRLERTADALRG